MSIVAIDFEASCLPRHGRSYPIEVGIAGDGIARSWIIRPHDDWAGWSWTAEAEALHGLSRDRVMREGVPAYQVMRELEDAVQARRFVADSAIDQYWMDVLARAAGAKPPRIDHVSRVFDEWGVSEEAVSRAIRHADACGAIRHRAGGDALWLATVIDHVRAGDVRAPEPLLEAAQ